MFFFCQNNSGTGSDKSMAVVVSHQSRNQNAEFGIARKCKERQMISFIACGIKIISELPQLCTTNTNDHELKTQLFCVLLNDINALKFPEQMHFLSLTRLTDAPHGHDES